jgi:RND family efflux transporter MFP subunit
MKVMRNATPRARRAGYVLILAALGLLAASCGGEQPAQQTQAPPVTVAQPQVRDIHNYGVFTGSSRAVESADVMARVSGTLETIAFEPSSVVAAGDTLFTIEETRYRAARDAAQAALRSAEANLLRAETELKRVEKASRSKAVSEMDVDRSRADRDMARAEVSAARARLDDAELNLSYTKVVAPIDGVVSRNLVDRGNLVGQAGPTHLTTVKRLRPIHVYFHAPETAVLNYLAQRRAAATNGDEFSVVGVPARVELANETGYPHQGVIDYVDNRVDPRTGTVELRLRLDNEDLSLFPGLFVRIKVEGPAITGAVLVPETAVGSDLGGKYVLTVDADNVVRQLYVQLGAVQEDGTVHVRQGLRGDETIVVNGLAFARPGSPVTPLTAEQMAAMKKQGGQG